LNEKDGTDVAERRRKERNFLYGPLGKEGIHLLVDEAIVLALKGDAELRAWQGKRWVGGELRAKTLHSLQSVLGGAEDVPPKM
jgi:hypothetical protein